MRAISGRTRWGAVLGATSVALLAGCTASTGGRALTPAEGELEQSGFAETVMSGADDPDAAFGNYASAGQWWGQMSLPEQVASVLMLHFPGEDPVAIAAFVQEFRPGGMILMGDNIPQDEEKLVPDIAAWAYLDELPLLVAVDQEGGVVSRLSGDPGRGATELRDANPATTEESFRARADYLRHLGFNTNFGIVADTTSDQSAYIWNRVLGSSPEQAAEHVVAAVEGEDDIVLSVLKHFPGHGTVTDDTHLTVPQSDLTLDEWLAGPAVPFAAGIEAGADMVMVGHLLFPAIEPLPASVSPEWHKILRDELGFEGVIITDDMKMLRDSGVEVYADAVTNAVGVLNAGGTIVLDIGGDTSDEAYAFARELIDGMVGAVESGALPEETLRAAGLKVLELRETLPRNP